MKGALTCLLALALIAPAASAGSPLGKVLELLDDLAAKVRKEGEVEEKAYKEYVEWCDDAATNSGFAIKTATSKKEALEATIGEASGDITSLAEKIEQLAASSAKDEAELKEATALREKEKADFLAGEKELMETLDVLERAIRILEREIAKHPAALAQVDASSTQGIVNALSTIVDAVAFTTADKNKLVALVQDQEGSGADDEEFGAPAAAAYKSKSGGIVDILEDLKEKAEEQLAALRKAEVNAQHNFDMVKQSLEDQIASDTKDFEKAKASKAAKEEAKATAEKNLQATVADLADAKESLANSNENCMQIAADHEATVAARAEELKVIAEAKKILEESTSGAADKSYSLLQLAQSSLRSHADVAKLEVTTLVKKLAKEQRSAALAQLASRIAAVMRLGAAGAGGDVFGKVKGLITDMIAKLEKEAGQAATEKAYCDEQMTKTQAKYDDLSADISKLSAKIDKATAASAALKEDVKESQAELAALAKQQAEMDKIRQETHADYVEAKTDLEAGLGGVRKALGVLRSYYGGAAAAASMLQGGGSLRDAMAQPAMPEQHEKATGAGQSIIGILEVVESDFAKNLAAEETEESDAQAEYEKTTQQNKVTKTMKEQDVVYATKEAKSLDKSLSEMAADRETTDTELAAVSDYFAKIKERCIAKPETYAERAKRRQAEIAGLKEALNILEDETALVQRAKRRAGRGGHFLAPGEQ